MMRSDLRRVIPWVWQGKSARRALLNVEIARSVVPQGTVLDIGGKGQPSYKGALSPAHRGRWIGMDLVFDKGIAVCGDVTCIPIGDQAVDTITCFNVLEHIWDYKAALNEFKRVLKVDGVLYGYVPFICNVHRDPSDFWRFTDETLQRSLEEAGFAVELIRPHGGVFISSFDLMSFTLQKVPPLRVLFLLSCLAAEYVLGQLRPSYAERYPVGYFFAARKFSAGK